MIRMQTKARQQTSRQAKGTAWLCVVALLMAGLPWQAAATDAPVVTHTPSPQAAQKTAAALPEQTPEEQTASPALETDALPADQAPLSPSQIPSDVPETGIALEEGLPTEKAKPGERLTVHVPLVMEHAGAGTSLRNITVRAIQPDNPQNWPFENQPGGLRSLSDLSEGARAEALYEWKISQKAAKGIYDIHFEVKYLLEQSEPDQETQSSAHTSVVVVQVEVLEDGNLLRSSASSGGTLELETHDSQGQAFAIPAAETGQPMQIVLHLKNLGEDLTDIVIAPNLSSDVDEFPFVLADEESLTKRLKNIAQGETASAAFDFVVNPKATKGQKSVGFRAVYRENGRAKESKFYMTVNISKGAAPTPKPIQTQTNVPEPAISIQNYGVTPSQPMAGEEFVLHLDLANKGQVQARHLRIAFSSLQESNNGRFDIVIPVDESADALFLDKLEVDESSSHEWKLRVSEEALNMPYALSIQLQYENSAGKQLKTERTIHINVVRPVSLALDEPLIPEGTHLLGQPVEIQARLRNDGLGTARLTHLALEAKDIDMEPRKLVESLRAGEEKTYTLAITPKKEGELPGALILEYTGEDGQKRELSRNFSLQAAPNAQESTEYDEQGWRVVRGEDGAIIGKQDPQSGEWQQNQPSKKSAAIWVAIGCGIFIAGSLLGVLLYLRRRSKVL